MTVQPPVRPTPDPATLNKDLDSAAESAARLIRAALLTLSGHLPLFSTDRAKHDRAEKHYAMYELACDAVDDLLALARAKPADSSGLFAGHRDPGSGLAPAETVAK